MNGVAVGHRWILAVTAIAAIAAGVLLGGCGGGGEKTGPGGATGGTVANSQLAQKIGLESNGAGEYRLGGCTAKRVLSSPGAIQRARQAGEKVVTDPTGAYGIVIEDNARCEQVMEEAVAILNVP
jgi:hypothetical protein